MSEDRRVSDDRAEYLTPVDLVSRWKNQVSVRTLANWRVQGLGPSFVKIGNRVLYELSRVLAWEQTRHMKQSTRRMERQNQ